MAIDNKVINGAIMTVLAIIILFAVYAAVVPKAQDEGNELATRGTELTVQTRCEKVGCFWNTSRATTQQICSYSSCFWNDTRTTDCTTKNVSSKDTNDCTSSFITVRAVDCTTKNSSWSSKTVCPTTYSAIPLGTIFSSSGVIFIVIMVALLLTIIMALLGKNKFK
jgi:hypothetical protein